MPEVLHYDVWRDFTPASEAVSLPSIELYDAEFPLAPMLKSELDIFNAQFPTLLGVVGSEERRIQMERVDVFMLGLRAIKYKLENPTFKGFNPADGELGFGSIRPLFTCVGAAAAGGIRANWNQALVANTWTDFLSSGATTGYQLGREFGLVVTYLASYITPTPFVSEIHNVIGRTDLIPTDVRPIKLADNVNGIAYYPIPTMFVLPHETWWMEILADAAGTDIVAPCGIVVGLGRVLKQTVGVWTA